MPLGLLLGRLDGLDERRDGRDGIERLTLFLMQLGRAKKSFDDALLIELHLADRVLAVAASDSDLRRHQGVLAEAGIERRDVSRLQVPGRRHHRVGLGARGDALLILGEPTARVVERSIVAAATFNRVQAVESVQQSGLPGFVLPDETGDVGDGERRGVVDGLEVLDLHLREPHVVSTSSVLVVCSQHAGGRPDLRRSTFFKAR